HAASGVGAGCCCTSRAMASRGTTTPLTLTIVGFAVMAADRIEQEVILLLRRCGITRPAPHSVFTARAHHLIAAPAEIPDRRRPAMDEPREREDEEECHAEEEVRLEDPVHVGHLLPDIRLQRKNALCPGHELHHLVPIE